MNIQELDKKYIAGTYSRFPVTLVSGKGSVVKDDTGKEYIDLGAGIAVTSFGISDDCWKNAVVSQLDKLQHTSNLYYTEPCAILAEKLCTRTGMKKVFFSNSGAEANECAIKAARKYAAERKGEDSYTIITLKNSFHGRTLTTLAATGQDRFHQLFKPLTPGFVHAQPGCMEEIEALGKQHALAGIMIECVQGEGGVIALDAGYVRDLAAYAKENDLVLIVDEVQTGNGRTGMLYGYMNYGIEPDVVSTAKGLAGGLPLGATMLGDKVQDVFGPGDHGSTFGGNPISCAAAISVLDRIDDSLLEDVRRKSKYVFNCLSSAPGIESVDGMGLMIGIKTVKPVSQVIAACMEKGVLCLTAKDKIRILPALNIPDALLEKGISVIKESCKE